MLCVVYLRELFINRKLCSFDLAYINPSILMASRTVKRSFSNHSQNGVLSDRLSPLPDPIVGHILSFLPTKQAITTMILSKSWMYLWTSITNLDFDDCLKEFDWFSIPKEKKEMRKNDFVQFVHKVLLLLCSPRIDKFSLKSHLCGGNSFINTCVDTATRRGVQQLEVSVEFGEPVKCPRNILSCSSLVILKLIGDNIVVNVPTDSVSLPKLKTLHLEYVIYDDGNNPLQKILPGCPVICELDFRRDEWKDNCNTSIVSTSLLSLKLDLDVTDWTDFYPKGSHLEIKAPALQYLEISDGVSETFSFGNLSSLDFARIDYFPGDWDVPEYFVDSVRDVLIAIANVRELNVSLPTMRVLHFSPKLGFTFPKLRELEVTLPVHWCQGLPILLDTVHTYQLDRLDVYSES